MLSCVQKQQTVSVNENFTEQSEIIIQSSTDTSIINYYEKISFVDDNGVFLKYFCNQDDLIIEYGNNDFKERINRVYPCEHASAITPLLWSKDNERILLSFGCGRPCWGLLELPLAQEDTVKEFMYHFHYDKESDILIHIDYYEPKDKYVMFARNLSTERYELIDLEDCEAEFIGYCVDSINISNKELFIVSRTEEDIKNGYNTKGSLIKRQRLKI